MSGSRYLQHGPSVWLQGWKHIGLLVEHALGLAEHVRYNQRSAAERVNGNLEDNGGGNHVRVRGAPKVFCHLMFGILVVTVEQIMRLVT